MTTATIPTTTTTSTSTRTGATLAAGGLLWVLAGLVNAGSAPSSVRFELSEAIWVVAQSLLLVGVVGLARLRPHGRRRLGAVGFGIAIAGRAVFVAAEALSLVQGVDDNLLLPVGALLTTIGMVSAGIAVVRERRWAGPARWAPLAYGAYPLAFMFPVLALTGAPPEPMIVLWGLAAAGLGAAVAQRSA